MGDDLGNADAFGCGGKVLGGLVVLGNVTQLVRSGGFLLVCFCWKWGGFDSGIAVLYFFYFFCLLSL